MPAHRTGLRGWTERNKTDCIEASNLPSHYIQSYHFSANREYPLNGFYCPWPIIYLIVSYIAATRPLCAYARCLLGPALLMAHT